MLYDKKNIIACLDIASNKVASLIGTIDNLGKPFALGYGVSKTEGFQDGRVSDANKLTSSILSSLSLAETMAKHNVKSVIISLSSLPFKSLNLSASVAFNFEKIISFKDLEQCAKRIPIQKNINVNLFSVVHVIPIKYILDDKKEVVNPVGLSASSLKVFYQVIAVDSLLMNDILDVVKRANLHVLDVVINPYADALSVLVDDDKRIGSMVVDIGKSSTYLSIFHKNNFLYSLFIPMGGDYISNYICKNTHIKFDEAERLKMKYGAIKPLPLDFSQVVSVSVISSSGQDELVDFAKADILNIIYPIVNMLVNFIKTYITDKDLLSFVNRIVITGGGANIKGITSIFQENFSLPVRLGKPIKFNGLDDDIYSFENSTLFGLFYFYIFKSSIFKKNLEIDLPKKNNIFNKIKKFINDNF